MRILIDLQACQYLPRVQAQELLDLVFALHQLCQETGTDEIIVTYNLEWSASADHLQTALLRFLPLSQIRPFSLPAQDFVLDQTFRAHSRALIREYFLQQLHVDLVYVPFAGRCSDYSPGQAVHSAHLLAGGAPTIWHALLLQNLGQLTCLQHGSLLLLPTATTARTDIRCQVPGRAAPLIPPISSALPPSPARKRLLLGAGKGLMAVAGNLFDILARLPQQAGQEWEVCVLACDDELEPGVSERLQQTWAANQLPAAHLSLQNAAPGAELHALLAAGGLFLHYSDQHHALAWLAMAHGLPLLAAADCELASALEAPARYAAQEQTGLYHALQKLCQDPALRQQYGQHNAQVAHSTPLPQVAQAVYAGWRMVVQEQQEVKQAATGAALPNAADKPRLAYISPLPPEKSGIADYSAELIPQLAQFYAIDLVLVQDEIKVGFDLSQFPVRSVEWFDQHAHQYQHILYHFGNSAVHQHMFQLLERHPGVVVLHDFFLANVLDYMHHIGYVPLAFNRALYQSHGFSALYEQKQTSVNDTIWKYPCNREVLRKADGIIVHSSFPRQLAQQWYDAQVARDWQVLPLLRGKPAHLGENLAHRRQQARARFGLQEQDFVLCTFGMLGRTKNNAEILNAWLMSPLAREARCHLVFVGSTEHGHYGRALQQKIDAARLGKRINITGFVSHEDYCDWLLATDCAVQLRSNSRGETSAAVLDCLLYGVPTVINAHGSSAELPPDVVLKLADGCSDLELAQAFTRLYQDPALRRQLAQAGQDYIAREHAPHKVGQAYQQALAHFATHGKQRAYQNVLRQLTSTAPPDLQEEAWIDLATALAHNRPPEGQRQLFVDVSAMVQTDLKTGIQRVVRSILLDLLAHPPAGFRIEPVFMLHANHPYMYARYYTQKLIGCEPIGLDDTPIEVQPGDIFLGLDLFMNGVVKNHQVLQDYQRRGLRIMFVVYDILPVLRPDAFPAGSSTDFAAWLHSIASLSEGLLCISRAVADELHTWLEQHPPLRQRPLQLGWFHLGADINASLPTRGMPDNAEQILHSLRERPSLLMVGTVEPRKGHTQTLAAFELLWEQGVDVSLVIVGKKGWLKNDTVERIEKHKELGKRLFWLSGISDEMLLAVYQACAALLAPSEGEGFGLPLIEAAQHGIPIIVRRLPVFEEVMGAHGFYFDGLQGTDLAQAIQTWLGLHAEGKAPLSKDMPWLTWEQSAAQLKQAMLDGKWYRQWIGS